MEWRRGNDAIDQSDIQRLPVSTVPGSIRFLRGVSLEKSDYRISTSANVAISWGNVDFGVAPQMLVERGAAS